MELTFAGLAVLIIGTLIVIAGTLRQALVFLLASTLFSGSAAILLPALGSSSIPPVQFALGFVLLRIWMPGSRAVGDLYSAFKANRWLALFTLYGMTTAIILPRLFAGAFDVYPMYFLKPDNPFATVPLVPTSQNLTAAFYLLGTLLAAATVWTVCRRKGAADTLVTTLVAVTWVHLALGIIGALFRGTPFDALLELFRNSTYIQLDDEIAGFVRIRGIFPEASSYAAFGFILFVTNAELWYRSIRSRATGVVALAMGITLFFSTSSTAYVSLGIYALFFGLRLLALPGIADPAKARAALVVAGSLVFVTALTYIAAPAMIESVFEVVRRMTIEKSSSGSGLQRLYWTVQGWELFKSSYGLGVGAGSFRSSSMFVAMLGSMGVIGIASFLTYLATVFQPWRRSSWAGSPFHAENLGGALGSAALLSLIPAAINSATAVPGASFAILAGASLALRPFDFARRAGAADATGQTAHDPSPSDATGREQVAL